MNRAIVVLGMHRSGTSAITRGLEVLGVRLGDRLLPPVPGDNDKGFCEDADIQALNVDLMSALGHRWDSLGAIGLELLAQPVVTPFLERATALMRGKASLEIVGIKDPRMCRLFPFWREVFGRLDWNVGCVIALRNPLAVARSLERRNGLDITKGACLWLLHMYEALRASSGLEQVVVHYDELLSQPRRQLGRVAAALGLLPPESAEPALREYSERFLDASLQRVHGSLADLENAADVPPIVSTFYEQLAKVAADGVGLESDETSSVMQQVAAAVADLEPVLAFAERTTTECDALAALSPGRPEVFFQVFPHGAGGYTESTSAGMFVRADRWQHVVLEIAHGSTGRIRVDPANSPCVIQFDSVVLKHRDDGRIAARWIGPAEVRSLSFANDLVLLPEDHGASFLSMGTDPQFLLPELDSDLAGQPLVLEAWVRVGRHLAPAIASLLDESETRARQALAKEQHLSSLAEEEAALLRDRTRELESLLAARESELRAFQGEIGRLRLDLEHLSAELEVAYQSRSWRATAPLRRLARAVRGVR